MFAKVFTQILDSSLANDYQVRHVFEDLLKLADINGVVDSTIESIARRTNVPVEIVERAIRELEKPDPTSRTPDHEGRRLLRVDDHRDWGWFIVNYDFYRDIASEEQRREKTRSRVQKFRKKALNKPCNAYVTHGNAVYTPRNDSPSTSPCTSSSVLSNDGSVFLTIKKRLCDLYKRTDDRLTYEEECNLLEVSKRPEVVNELEELKAFKASEIYFPQSLTSLLGGWSTALDRCRNKIGEIKPKSLNEKGLENIMRL